MLANEQVVDGLCERCDTPVTKKKLTQWYLRITDYADRLLDDMDQLEGSWPDKVLRCSATGSGARPAPTSGSRSRAATSRSPSTPPGRTPCSARRSSWSRPTPTWPPSWRAGRRPEFAAYLEQVKATSEIDRLATDRPKTGVFLHRYAINPVNGERLPIYASDYVLADYGTGAIMAVPAHDQRDLDFARTFDLPVRVVVAADTDPAETGVATADDGAHVNSGPLDGLDKDAAIARIIEMPGRARDRRGGGQLPAARLADLPAALLGHADPDRPLPGLRRGRRSPTTSCRSCCRRPRAST